MKKLITLLTAIVLLASCAKDEDTYFLFESNSDIIVKAFSYGNTDRWNRMEIFLPKGKVWRFMHSQVYKIEVHCTECSYFIDGVYYDKANTFTVSTKLVAPLHL